MLVPPLVTLAVAYVSGSAESGFNWSIFTSVAMLVPRGDQQWINFVNHWIRLQNERGFFEELKAKWSLVD